MILVVCGPSGAGKSTLVRGLMARHPELAFSVSHTTRPPRGDERDGVAYHFVGEDQFAAMVAAEAFAEHALVHGHRYGTAHASLEAIEAAGSVPVLDIDYQGAEQILARYPEATSVLVTPPSMRVLEARLRGRDTDTEAQVRLRLEKARLELSQYRTFRYLVVNDDVDVAISRLESVYLAERSRVVFHVDFLAGLVGHST
jgi:guanylate kinase